MPENCICENPPFHYSNYEKVKSGTDAFGAEVTLEKCKYCKNFWLVYLLENPHYSNSGRWWRTKIASDDIEIENARSRFEQSKSCFIGGSYFQSNGTKVIAPIKIT